MGVNVKLADAREVDGKKRKAGDVVAVDPGEARVLVAIGAGVKVDGNGKTAAGKAATDKPGETGRKG